MSRDVIRTTVNACELGTVFRLADEILSALDGEQRGDGVQALLLAYCEVVAPELTGPRLIWLLGEGSYALACRTKQAVEMSDDEARQRIPAIGPVS